MAIEPVNERPIFPALMRADSNGVGQWSTSMIRQLTTVFQQYGYKLNKAVLDEQLTANGGTVPETDQINTWTVAQVFNVAPSATGHPLRFDDLAANGGSIPETDRTNSWTADQDTSAAGFRAFNVSGAWFDAHVTDDSNSGIFRGRDSAGTSIGEIQTRDFNGAGAGYLLFVGDWQTQNPIELYNEPWQSVTFQNGWQNYGGSFATCQYRKLSNGMVVLKGLVRNGTPNTVIFTLPVAYRPTEQHIFAQKDNTGISRIDVRPDGTVDQLSNEGTGWVSLSGISFYTG